MGTPTGDLLAAPNRRVAVCVAVNRSLDPANASSSGSGWRGFSPFGIGLATGRYARTVASGAFDAHIDRPVRFRRPAPSAYSDRPASWAAFLFSAAHVP